MGEEEMNQQVSTRAVVAFLILLLLLLLLWWWPWWLLAPLLRLGQEAPTTDHRSLHRLLLSCFSLATKVLFSCLLWFLVSGFWFLFARFPNSFRLSLLFALQLEPEIVSCLLFSFHTRYSHRTRGLLPHYSARSLEFEWCLSRGLSLARTGSESHLTS
ncbi:hypothetical protein BO86DRAFT_29510 [Aspergillus japonicus CBS 114.51]|uniref:Transmembrane protein n=1 Tax=Aspergillus japonicus CBS 114.51 TaxID=1448312 RepID=A0A8T8WK33_ASPJA|nr:hypothetical protein BO86DRAFT_29510 [Aspergillus japonicus CBS 114.51]RAH76096.1 hypothetical protein BO86DRAFT_29510 [Aspergillus japonicus CBS 114.51]